MTKVADMAMTIPLRERAPRGLRTSVIVLGALVGVAWFAVVVSSVAVGLTRANKDTTGTSTAADILLVAGPTAILSCTFMAVIAWWRRVERVALAMIGTALFGIAAVHVLLWWAGVTIAGY